ncbi:hypothetical protein [Pyxidicoccus trucidator]|uniref:hypothetical protein n=1 Tax=Pyxidicoccus trucidator TaxID=2709662 RepID=UPI0013DA50C3|nr:hypothetical protein [Pyxidicoccus trucidator]
MTSNAGFTILDWTLRPDYLARQLLRDARLVKVKPGIPAAAMAEEVFTKAGGPGNVLLHIDASTPADFIRPLEAFCGLLGDAGYAVWNGAMHDIRKRSIHSLLQRLNLPCAAAKRDGDPDTRVIVKTNLNSRGIAEWEVPDEHRSAMGWPERTPSPLDGIQGYRVMRRKEVDASWWDDPRLVLEEYIDNRDGAFCRVYFCGEQMVICEGKALTEVRRMADGFDRYDYLANRKSILEPVLAGVLAPPVVAAALAALAVAEAAGLDYGSIDLVRDDAGIPYVVDINLTPYWGRPDGDVRMVDHLRHGLG